MNIYVLVALAAVLAKIYIGILSRKHDWASPAWFFLVSVFLLQNLTELISYHQLSREVNPEYLVKVYFIAVAFLSSAVLRFVCERGPRLQRSIASSFFGLAFLFSYLVLFTPYILNGYVYGAFPIESIKGKYFSLYLLMVLASTVLSLFFIIYNIRSSESKSFRKDQFYHLFSLAPLLILGCFIAAMMLFGFSVNGSGIFPAAGTIFMLSSYLFRFRPNHVIDSLIPFTKERVLVKEVGSNTIEAVGDNKSLSQIMDDHERVWLKYHIVRIGRNKSRISATLDIDRRTLDRKLKKHDLWWKG